MPPHATNNYSDFSDYTEHHNYSQSSYECPPLKSKPLAPKACRVIRFAPNDEVKEIVHINDLKRITDINSLWYTKRDYDTMRSDIKDTVALMEKTESSLSSSLSDGWNNEHHCTRGLERKTTKGRQLRKQRIVWAQFAVFDEQELQEDEGTNDPDMLADVYYEMTYKSQLMAQEIARQYHEESHEESLV